MLDIHKILEVPLVTEKTEKIKTSLKGSNRFTFYVHRKANKDLIRKALKLIYKVDAKKINIMNTPHTLKRFRRDQVRKPGRKKAIVTLYRGQSIEFTSGEN